MKIDVVQLERLGAALSDGLVIGDAEGYVLSANRAACALLGLPPGARPDQVVAVLAGVPRAPVASPSSGPVASLAASLSPEGPHELCLRGADGRVRHLSLSAVALGQPTLVEALVLCELSHLPPIAEPLPLPSEVRRLQQLRDEILSIASHELKNPLTVILGYSAVLAGAAEVRAHPRLSRAADSVRQQSQRMRRLVDQLLDFARLGLGQLTLQRATFSIAEQVRAVAEHYASPDHPLQPTVEGEPLIVAGDTMRLERVLSTLVAGAIRHCPPGAEIAIEI
ncbi:MAG: hypothetical protein RLZZ387_18, partial [Chloroflexota bacterium]